MTRFSALGSAFVLVSSLACGGGPVAPSTPPRASFTVSPLGIAIVGVTAVAFDAAKETSAQTSYAWDFGDGTTATGPTAIHVYSGEGTFMAVLTATNRVGSTTASSTITTRSVTGMWKPDFL